MTSKRVARVCQHHLSFLLRLLHNALIYNLVYSFSTSTSFTSNSPGHQDFRTSLSRLCYPSDEASLQNCGHAKKRHSTGISKYSSLFIAKNMQIKLLKNKQQPLAKCAYTNKLCIIRTANAGEYLSSFVNIDRPLYYCPSCVCVSKCISLMAIRHILRMHRPIEVAPAT